ncbi:acyl-CoA dehydrogenase [[Mycobacterium] vasticus]|uniref:Acyl-CoA dehydrogenase n=1 Tax=[Mycobacterium] vasticus TaxID=2875777 RepID=A0ABU5YZW3_9MYCO|nr:acyl-CoA dehydrogenase [Mycolicibacter sp. MYC017]MEB3070691.1 acyl-CoA dehydrogenase [Mycolicibacter sp. MYC017]
MDMSLTDEQQQLAKVERSWLQRHDSVDRLRKTLDSGGLTLAPEAIQHAAESGLLGLLTPEMGGTHADLAVVSEVHGHAASCLPIADLAMAGWVLGQVRAASAEAAVSGKSLFGIARRDARMPGQSTPVPMAADLAGVVIVDSSEAGEHALLLENPDLVDMSTLDLTRTWGRARIDESAAYRRPLPIGTVAFVRDALVVHRSLDALGAAAHLLDMTVTYASQREQFGAPIGSFQAVKHHCANMEVSVQASRSLLYASARSLDSDNPIARARLAAAGAAYAKSAAAEVAGTALQVHGGIGFTWEHDLHLFLRRIKVDQAMDGTVAEHRAALAALQTELSSLPSHSAR